MLTPPVEERGAIADAIADSFLTEDERRIEQLWVEECERRIADVDAGRVQTLPFDVVMAELRARFGSSR